MSSGDLITYIMKITRDPTDIEVEAGATMIGLKKHLHKILDEYDQFHLKQIPISRLDWSGAIDENLIERYASMYASGQKNYPPIVLDEEGEIIDGTHRVGGLETAGEKFVWAYIPMDSTGRASTL